MVLSRAMSLFGYQPIEYRLTEICLKPVGAPSVAQNPVMAAPRMEPKIINGIVWYSFNPNSQPRKPVAKQERFYIVSVTERDCRWTFRTTHQCARRPQKEHRELRMPRHWLAIFWKLAIDCFCLHAHFTVHRRFHPTQLTENAIVLLHGRALIFDHIAGSPRVLINCKRLLVCCRLFEVMRVGWWRAVCRFVICHCVVCNVWITGVRKDEK